MHPLLVFELILPAENEIHETNSCGGIKNETNSCWGMKPEAIREGRSRVFGRGGKKASL